MGLIFARHGETIFNLQERLQGLSDSDLTDKGIDQASKLGDFLIPYKISKILSSPLKRAVDTSNIVNSKLNIEIKLENSLKEVCYGEWETRDKVELKNLEHWKDRELNRFSFVHPGVYLNNKGESYENLFNRLKPFLITLDEILNDSDNFYLLISHQGVMLCAYIYFLNLSIEESADLRIPNNEIAILAKIDNQLKFRKHLL